MTLLKCSLNLVLHRRKQGKDETRVAAGLKATIKNPRTSEEAKDSAQERLQDIQADESSGAQQGQADKVSDNVLRGHKATLSSKISTTALICMSDS